MSIKVVSLLPSAAEIIGLFIAQNKHIKLVGRSHEDDHPHEIVKGVPILTAAKTKFTTTEDIDRQVTQLLSEGDGLYDLNVELLKELKPDVVVTQDLCHVCSIDLTTVQRAAKELDPIPTVVTLNPISIDDVISSITDVGAAFNLVTQSRDIITKLASRITYARNLANTALSHRNGYYHKVAFFEWTAPIYAGGHWTPQVIRWSGGAQVINDCKDGQTAQIGAAPSFRVPPENLIEEKPEIVIICPCGLDLDTTRKEYEDVLKTSEWWPELMKNVKKLALVDGNQMFNRPGPRLVDALEWLTGYINNYEEIIPKDFPWENIKNMK